VHAEQHFFTDPNNPIVARLPDSVRAYLAKVPAELAQFAGGYAGTAASGVLAIVLSVVGLIATLVVIPVLAAYMIIEAPRAIRSLLYAIPERARPEAILLLRDVDRVLGGFIRGQLLVGATIGACITIALLVLHVKYAVLIGVAAGLLDVIPYVGAVVGFVPAVSLAFFNDGLQHALIVAAVFALIFQLEGHFIAPKIVSDSVGLTPLAVIVAILIGASLLGIAGMFLAVPIAGVLRVILLRALPALRQAPPVEPPPPIANPTRKEKSAPAPAGARS